jgi:hypothetical protein
MYLFVAIYRHRWRVNGVPAGKLLGSEPKLLCRSMLEKASMTASATSAPQRNVAFQTVPTILLVSSFWLSCIFYSVGYNLLMLQLAVAGPLLCLLIAGPERLWSVLQNSRMISAVGLGTIVLLSLHYSLFSISPEASYPYAWVMASIPLWLLALSVMAKPHFVAIGIAGSVLAMALVSDVRFILDGQRAYDPLADTNNYASLVYLTLIPATHYLLLRLWQRPSPTLYAVLVG